MSDLFKKLNLLIKTNLGDLVEGSSRREALPTDRLGSNIDREIRLLRQQVNKAVDYEAQLGERVAKLQADVARWDTEADDAVRAGNNEAARYAIEQMQRAQQHLTIAENDRHEHHLVTQDLIRRVNQLEAVVADSRQREQDTPPAPAADSAPAEAETRGPAHRLADVLRETREKIAQFDDVLTTKDEQAGSGSATPDPTNRQEIDDDLAQRRSRLSK